MKDSGSPSSLRRQELPRRRETIKHLFDITDEEWDAVSATPSLLELSDVMVEQAVGCMPLPLGVADGFIIDGRETLVPMAVEEPSVIAAASFAARLVARDGGFVTTATQSLMTAQVFLERVDTEGERRLRDALPAVRAILSPRMASLEKRGGGFRGMQVTRLPVTSAVRVDIVVDVRDAMGANILNTAAEGLRALLEAKSGGISLMAILSNAALDRIAGASFRVPVRRFSRVLPEGMSAAEAARRIALASDIAQEDPTRAVTHNKGIMNGITSLAIATMNDARAIEAAAHAFAARDGRYRGLSTFRVHDDTLIGEISLPLPLGTVGGAIDLHPAAQASLRILGGPDANRLSRIGAALGLAQNLAALLALTTWGIQHGHMRLHAARVAWRAGARGDEVRRLADELSSAGTVDIASARRLIARMRAEGL
jgi:hydroxymethylglutaryl-CoA reductase